MQDQATGQNRRWDLLRSLVQAVSLRRTKASVGEELNLPGREEHIEYVSLDSEERHFYNLMKRCFATAVTSAQPSISCFQLILRLRQICNHGVALLPEAERIWLQNASIYSDFIPLSAICENCSTTLPGSAFEEDPACFHQICKFCIQQAKEDLGAAGDETPCPVCGAALLSTTNARADEPLPTITPKHEVLMENYSPSSKVKALIRNLIADKSAAQGLREDPPKR